MDKKLLEKYVKNNCTPEELKLLIPWFRDLSPSSDFMAELYRICEELPDKNFESRINFDDVLNRIHNDISLEQTRLLIENNNNDLISKKRRKSIVRSLANIAAVLLLPFIGISVFMTVKYYSVQSENYPITESYNEILSSVDAITQVTLPDGSFVWLNRRSSLRYPAVFAKDQRHVELKGEGYFEVNQDPHRPFIISADKIQVIARGTSLNVMAYPEEENIETTLISGNVELRKPLSEGRSEILCLMNPSDLSVYNKNNGDIKVKTVQDDRHFSWKYGKLVFTAEPLTEVIKKLNRWFNVDIEITDQKLKDLTLTATFIHETLPQVMDLISQVSPINYTITKREISADGTYTPRRVKLYSQDN